MPQSEGELLIEWKQWCGREITRGIAIVFQKYSARCFSRTTRYQKKKNLILQIYHEPNFFFNRKNIFL